jgi:hypothetical protein
VRCSTAKNVATRVAITASPMRTRDPEEHKILSCHARSHS